MKTFKKPNFKVLLPKLVGIVAISAVIGYGGWQWYTARQELMISQAERQQVEATLQTTQATLAQVQQELDTLKNEDPRKTNRELQARIDMVEKAYDDSVAVYEDLNDFENGQYPDNQVEELRKLFATTIKLLADQKYEDALKNLAEIKTKTSGFIAEYAAKLQVAAEKEAAKLAAAGQTATTTTTGGAAAPTGPVSNDPPANGYRRQVVQSDAGQFTVSIVAGDLGSTRAIVDTASGSDCANDCPVLPLADYVSRNGAYAGINGTYFCPASYPSCAGKTNTFDLLVMNKDKTYFNSANNVYSTNPGVVFQSGSMRFVGQMSQWGRDTGVDGVLSNFPLLVSGGSVSFGGDDDPKKGSKGNRSFVANRGSIAYIGVVHSATVAETARVLKAMGMDNALNLDDGGSTALWFGGYKVGPGRALPNVILFKVK